MGHSAATAEAFPGLVGLLPPLVALSPRGGGLASPPSFFPYGPHWKWGTRGRKSVVGGIGDLRWMHSATWWNFPLAGLNTLSETSISN